MHLPVPDELKLSAIQSLNGKAGTLSITLPKKVLKILHIVTVS